MKLYSVKTVVARGAITEVTSDSDRTEAEAGQLVRIGGKCGYYARQGKDVFLTREEAITAGRKRLMDAIAQTDRRVIVLQKRLAKFDGENA